MADGRNGACEYHVEVSGWGLDDSFFVENTDLVWTEEGAKKLRLRHCLREGTVIFVRLLGTDAALGSVPVAYQVENVQPMNRLGLCEMDIHEVHPRSKQGSPGRGDRSAQDNLKKDAKLNQEQKPARIEEIIP